MHQTCHTPDVITILTGIFVSLFAAFVPVGKLADISNSGTLFAFAAVSVAVMMLRKTDPHRRRPFRTPGLYFNATVAIAGCIYLFFSLSDSTKLMFVLWAVIGMFVYFLYSYRKSHVGRGIEEIGREDSGITPQPETPLPGAPTPGGGDA